MVDVGTPNELIRAQNELITKRMDLPFTIPPGQVTLEGGYIFDTAKTQSKITETVICHQSVVGKDCNIENSLIMNNSVIGDNTIIKNSVIGNNVKIAANCVLTGCVVGDNITIESGRNLTEQKIDS